MEYEPDLHAQRTIIRAALVVTILVRCSQTEAAQGDMKMKELTFVNSDQSANDKQWEEYEKNDDLFSFYCPDNDMIYVLKLEVPSTTKEEI